MPCRRFLLFGVLSAPARIDSMRFAGAPAQAWLGLGGKGGLPGRIVVPAEGIEPPTFGLQNRCSTAELSRHVLGNACRQRPGDVCPQRHPPCRGSNTRLAAKGPERLCRPWIRVMKKAAVGPPFRSGCAR